MNLLDRVHPEWMQVFERQRASLESIERLLTGTTINPKFESVMRAFEYSLEEVKVVIFGQDPYPNPGHAMGLAFSVPAGTDPLPKSLTNVLRELQSDIGGNLRKNGDLSDWADQGVALINRTLTFPANGITWKSITDEVASELGSRGVIAILWGKHAQELQSHFAPQWTITSPHPSPLSAHRGFLGSRPFSRANQFLAQKGVKEIDWLRD